MATDLDMRRTAIAVKLAQDAARKAETEQQRTARMAVLTGGLESGSIPSPAHQGIATLNLSDEPLGVRPVSA